LAVDEEWKGHRLGAADRSRVRAMRIHAISDREKRFYEKHGFVASPLQPMTLMATLPDLAAGFGILLLPGTGL
jgi:hypothetical protein